MTKHEFADALKAVAGASGSDSFNFEAEVKFDDFEGRISLRAGELGLAAEEREAN